MMIQPFVAALFGLLIGSFLNVLIIRLPKGESIVFPSSHCTKCQRKLRWWHNIPLLSWLLLRGKCHYCKEPISIQYPLVELFTALLFGIVAYKSGCDIHACFIAFVFTLLLALSLIDLRYKAVPDSINLLAALLAIFTSPNYLQNLTNGLLMAGGFSMLRFVVSYYVGKKVEFMLARERKRAPWIDVFHPRFVMAEAMGEGDIIVAFAMGALLGLKLSLIAVVLAALIALPASIVYRMFKKEAELPFIPFLALGTFFAYLFGERIAQIVF